MKKKDKHFRKFIDRSISKMLPRSSPISILILILLMIIKIIDCYECNDSKADECALNLIPLTNVNIIKKLPKTLNEIDEHCRKIRQYEQCTREYAKYCLRNESKQILSILLYSIGRVNKRYCQKESKKSQLLELIKCSGEKNFYYYNQLIQNASIELSLIKNYNDVKQRIPMACCLYSHYSNLAIEHVDKTCPKNNEEVDQILRGYSGDSFNFLCGDYSDDSNKCDSIINLIPKYNPSNDDEIKWKSMILPMVQMIDSLHLK